MTYAFTLGNNVVLEGNVATLTLIVFIVLVVLIGVILMVIRKLKENEVLEYEFITIIAHKFRTPLTHVKWLIESLLPSEQDSAKRESLADMQQSTNRLISLTGTLIELTDRDAESKSAYEMENLSLSELAKNVAAPFKNSFHEKNITLSVQSPAGDVVVEADRARIEFVLQTLLENAFNYTPPGRQVEVVVGAEGRTAIISVADNGIGIDPANLGHIFSKFYRAPNAQNMDTEGFGVGLYFSQSIVKRHGGKIEVFSEGLNRGSVFRILLPLK